MTSQQRGRGVETTAARAARLAPNPSTGKPYRVVVEHVDGTRGTFAFETYADAEAQFFRSWRSNRAAAVPTVYKVRLDEFDGDQWTSTRHTTPNDHQRRARHEHRVRAEHRARRNS